MRVAHFGTCCTTFARAAHPCYRSNAFPLGTPTALSKPKNAARIRESNALTDFTVQFFEEVAKNGGIATLENPATSLIWRHPSILPLVKKYSMDTFCMCSYGCRYRKRTRVLSSWPGLQRLQSRCRHKRHHIVLSGTIKFRGRWITATKLGNRYPKRLCSKWAQLLAAKCSR